MQGPEGESDVAPLLRTDGRNMFSQPGSSNLTLLDAASVSQNLLSEPHCGAPPLALLVEEAKLSCSFRSSGRE